jgi:hypothetical protein
MSEQKVRIAYDAWQMTLAPQITLAPGKYMQAPDVSDEAYLQAINDLPSSAPMAELPPCEVCALGALLVAKTLEYGGDGEAQEEGDLNRTDILHNLPFDDDDLDFIEGCFERTARYMGEDDERQDLLSEVDGLYEVGWDADDVARALFLNLIENEGRLKLSRKKDSLGLNRGNTLTDLAREVLRKFNIPCLHPQLPLPIEGAT